MWYKCSKRGNEQNNLTSSCAIPTHRCTWALDTPFSLSRSRLQPVPQLPIFFAHIEPLRHKEEIARSREAPLPCFACMMPFTGDKQNAMKEQNCSHAGIGKTIVARNQHGCRLASRSKRITWVKSIDNNISYFCFRFVFCQQIHNRNYLTQLVNYFYSNITSIFLSKWQKWYIKSYPRQKKKKKSHLPQQDWRIKPKPGRIPSAATTPTDHHLSPQNRPLQTE